MNALVERGPALHATARRLPPAAAVVLAVAVLAGVADTWSDVVDPDTRVFLVRALTVFPTLVAAVVLSVTLHGSDVDLDLTSPRLSSRGRGVRAVTTTVLACLVLAAGVALVPGGAEGTTVLRNTAGLLGTVLLTITLVPPALAWLPAFSYAAFTFLVVPDAPPPSAVWWAYLVQPARLDPSLLVAGALLVVGVLAYAVRGPRRGTS